MKKYVTKILRLVVFLTSLFAVLILLLSLIRHNDGLERLKSVRPISINGTATIDDGPARVIEGTDWYADTEHSLVVQGHFTHGISSGESLLIWPRYLYVKIYVNDELKITSGSRKDFPSFMRYAGNSYQIHYIGNITTTDKITIEVEKVYRKNKIDVLGTFFKHIYTGRASDVYQSFLRTEIIHPLIGMALIFVGILVLTPSFLQDMSQFKHVQHVHYLGWFCIVGGIKYACDSSYKYIDLLLPYPVFNTLIDFCSIPLLIFFYLMFITAMLTNTFAKRIMKWITTLFIIFQLFPIGIQFLGDYDLYEMQDYYLLMGGIMAILCYGSIIYESVIEKDRDIRRMLIAVLPLMFSLFLSIANIILEQGIQRTYLRIAILVTCILLLHYTARYMKRSMLLIEEETALKSEIQNTRIAIMLSQIQPHFLYNTLNTLQHICQKDGALAAEAIEHFARYLRGNMDSLTNDKPIPFTQELDHIQHYIYIQKLRFGVRVQVEYHLEVTDFSLPTLTLQPIVENAVRHGITKRAEGGLVKIETKRVGTSIEIIVSDNGVGISFEEKEDIYNRNHVGFSNVQNRLKLQCNGSIEITSEQGVGTQVKIRLKGTGT